MKVSFESSDTELNKDQRELRDVILSIAQVLKPGIDYPTLKSYVLGALGSLDSGPVAATTPGSVGLSCNLNQMGHWVSIEFATVPVDDATPPPLTDVPLTVELPTPPTPDTLKSTEQTDQQDLDPAVVADPA